MSDANDSSDIDWNQESERVCAILEAIASRYPDDSDESRALIDAALAHRVVHQHRHLRKAYLQLKNAYKGELSDAMIAKLRARGIDPDALEESI